MYEVLWREEHDFEIDDKTLATTHQELEKLSGSEQAWWVRLYVAEIMRQHPILRIDSVAAHLSADEVELVKQQANFVADRGQ